MKAGIITFVLLFAFTGSAFGQISLESFNKEWNITQEKLKADLKDKKIIENKAKGLYFISYEDELEKYQVRVDYTFNKEGVLTVKTITNMGEDKDYKPVFDIFKNDAVKKYGSKYIQKVSNGKNLLIWQPDENTRVFMSYSGLMVQYNIMKNAKPKSGG